MNASQIASAGNAALRRDVHRHVVQVEVDRLHRHFILVVGVDLFHHVGPDAGQRMIADHFTAIPQHRHAVAIGRRRWVEDRVDARAHAGRGGDHEERQADRHQPEQALVLQRQQHSDADSRTDPRVAGQRDRQRHEHRRHHQRRPQAIAVAEQQARAARARDEHQHARIGHVVRQRAVGAFAEIVVLEQAALGDADQRDDRADADDDRARG